MGERGFEQDFQTLRGGAGAASELPFRSNRSSLGRSKHGVWRVWAKRNDRNRRLDDLEVESEAGGEKPDHCPG